MSNIDLTIVYIEYDGIETVPTSDLVDLIIHYSRFTGKKESDREDLLITNRMVLESMVKILVWPNLSKVA